MKKVLFIIQSYPSNRSANVICDDKIMKAMLQTKRYEVHCLVYQFHGQSLKEELNGIKVHRFRRSKWWDLYTYARDNENELIYKMVVKLNRLYMRARQLFCIPIYPNYEPLLAKLVANEAIKLHSQEKFDLVVAEHSGRDTLYAGMKLKQSDSNVKFVSILWDPLSGRNLAKYLPEKYAQIRAEKDEAELLKNSDRIICLESNRKYQENHSSNKPFYRNIRFLDIPGIVPHANVKLSENFTVKGMINILYSGILTIPDRDPSILIQILNNSKYASKINLMFFSAGIEGIERANTALKNFKGKALIHPYVEKKLLDAIAANSDVLLNIGGPNPRMVPSKIFEYLSLGKPIISTYYIDDESSRKYLKLYPSAICLDIREPLNENIRDLDCFIESKLHSAVEFSTVKELYPKNTPQVFLDVFNEILD